VLFCAVTPADEDFRRDTASLKATEQWRRFKQNNEARFHFIRDVPADEDCQGIGLPALAVDFRHYFSVPTDEAYARLQPTQRRCRLDNPYLEHLSARFIGYLGRVALPLDHDQPLPEQPAAGAAPVPVTEAAAITPAEAGAGANGAAPVGGEAAQEIEPPPARELPANDAFGVEHAGAAPAPHSMPDAAAQPQDDVPPAPGAES
jgi:hypothetical protein